MHAITTSLIGAAVVLGMLSGSAWAQDAPLATTRARLTTLLAAAAGTPGGHGLVATARAEARIAVREAARVVEAPDDLASLQAGARGVLHAVEPALAPGGPGLGYGLRRATTESVQQLMTLLAGDGSPDVAQQGAAALIAARRTLSQVDEVETLARQVLAASTATEAAVRSRSLLVAVRRLTVGSTDTARRVSSPRDQGALTTLEFRLRVLQAARDGLAAASSGGTR